jgi:hypothetical protein
LLLWLILCDILVGPQSSDMWSNIILYVSVKEFLDENNI